MIKTLNKRLKILKWEKSENMPPRIFAVPQTFFGALILISRGYKKVYCGVGTLYAKEIKGRKNV